MIKNILLIIITLSFEVLSAQVNLKELNNELQIALNKIVKGHNIPGITLSVNFNDKDVIALASGFNDKEANVKMTSTHRMPSGSVGKIFVSTMVLQLAEQGKLNIDDNISKYLSNTSWFGKLPNAKNITVKNLLNHTSGLPRYIFQPEFISDIKANPLKNRTPESCIAYVLDKPAVHQVNSGWAYSDTNYIVLGLIIEKITNKTYYQLLQDNILTTLNLKHTSIQNKRSFNELSQGYIGSQNYFGLPLKTIKDGQLQINPAFEWTGGGVVTNVADLTKFIKALYETNVLSNASKKLLQQSVNMVTGKSFEQGYGLGTFVWSKRNDTRYGHSGFFPGYLSHVEYSKNRQYAIALQINTDEGLPLLQQFVYEIDEVISKHLDRIDKAQILQNFKKQEQCWNNADIECYMEAYATTEPIQTASRGGVTFGYDNIIGDYKKYFPKERMGKLHFDNFNYRRLSDNLYFVTGRFNLKFPNREELSRGWFSVTIKRINGEWKMITDHSS